MSRVAAPAPPPSSKAVRLADRPGYGTVGKKIQVATNHFVEQVAERELHQYDLSITPEVTSKKINRDVISELIQKQKGELFGERIPAYDGRKSLFTAGPLPFSSKDFAVKWVDNDKQSSSSGSPRVREREFKVTIGFAAKTDTHHFQQFLRRRQLDCPQETIQALDVALRATPSEKYDVVGRSFFSRLLGTTGPLGSGTEYYRGYYQSLRPTQMGLSLNIDVSATAFYEPILVTEFIAKHFNFNFSRPLSDQDRVKIKIFLRGVKLEFTHSGQTRCHKITGVSKKPLKELTFILDDKITEKSVVQYFGEKYKLVFKYLSLPALQAGSDTKPIYLPMELCQIAPGQRYTHRLNEEQVTALLRATCQRPHERQNYISQLKEEPVLVNALVLPPPTLKYHAAGKESRVEPLMGQWNMMNKKLIDAGKVQFWTCLNFSTRVNRDFPLQFCDELISMCISKGMFFSQQPLIPITSAHPSQIGKAFMDINEKSMKKLANMNKQGTKLQLLIIILPDVMGSYGKIKRTCETELGIVPQCCQPNQASKFRRQYLENVALKINVKVGGRNTMLHDKIIPHMVDLPTIILGADVTHPQPGEDSSPSIAAVVASMDWPGFTKYRGTVSAQPHREEIIQDLYNCVQDPKGGFVHGGMIRELLMAFYKANKKRKPDKIIYYGDGVSEGQFSQVLLHEMNAIRKACVSLEERYLPKVTFVVVQKGHHTRLFPVDPGSQDQTDRSGNIMPGTVVDSAICHPRENDFYLNSHGGIQGTNRPAHYHILFDENNFSADQLQTLTNNLCFTYARCTRSVSVVPPAYYAHLAAFRARNYIEGGTSEVGSTTSGTRTTNVEVHMPSIKSNVKEVMFYI